MLRFESNSAATSDGGAQKLGNDVRHDSESIATKVCSQIGRKWNAMFESHVVTSVDRTSFDFRFEDFLSNLPLQTFIYCVTDKASITRSRRSVLNVKASVLTFSRSMSSWWATSIEQKLCEVKKLQLQSMSNKIRCIDQRFACENSRISCLADAVLWSIDTNQWLSGQGESERVGRHGFDSWWVLKCCAARRPFCVALSPSVH